MSTGSTTFQLFPLRRLAFLTFAAVALAGCSSDDNTQAPISAINGSAGGHTSDAPASYGRVPTAPVINGTVPSGPGSSMTYRPVQRTAEPVQAPVRTENGHIVYDRTYGNIPKGSYNGPTYTVRRGDTLFYIAWITGNDFRDLAQRNNVAAPYSLHVGQVLQVGNSSGQPITGGNAISIADSSQPSTNPSATPSVRPVAQQPVITYSDDSGDETNSTANSGSKLLPSRSPVVGSASAPITAPVNPPTASSTSVSSAPITTWRWPTEGKIIDSFSASEGGNKGIDIAGSRGQPVVATAAGRVVYAGNALRGYGNLIIIKHNDDYLSAYAHNDTMLVREQQEVSAGQKIATMGSTGTSSVRLHFEIRYKGKSVNPLRYLPQR
ncbi:NlpD family lipoprotein [Tatumella ptyseos ATCC 33301]|uniref:NlpD family lipoprotein n=2 Tax=Tatumella ptyseos TaxID=82987 RepID=A0A085JAJ8_9GAMM|nr:murein hydrolase activator NlpD [Tatumella ptyseos]KFD17494.1 NlpD family lipoprotein [Tatumella ptyseos ATCC 33301]SQK72798.1 Murein hydrolase activator NlpD precursor [Tatumella ptyseos]